MRAGAIGAAFVLGASLLAAVALADTLRRGDRIAASAPAGAPATAYTAPLPGVVGALAVHADGRVAVSAQHELLLFDPAGKTLTRRTLSATAQAVGFGVGESVVAELATGTAVLRYRELFTRAWSPTEATRPAIEPAALPFGGFVVARGSDLVVIDGEGHELRRLSLGAESPIERLWILPNQGIFVLANRGTQNALLHCAWGERVTLRAVVRGTISDASLDASGLELALEDGSLARVELGTGAIERSLAPDDGHAVTALRHGRGVAIVHGQLVALHREGGTLRAGAPFGPMVARTDAGLVVPRVLVASAHASAPLWVLTADGSVWNVGPAGRAELAHASRCDSSRPAFFAATRDHVVIACQNRLTSLVAPASVPSTAEPGDAGFRW